MQEPATLLNVPARHPAQRTLVVFGLYRGGTSMLAAIARRCGVFMGHRFDPRDNHEDLDFQHAPPRRVRDLIRFRDLEQDVWGWKYPGVYHTIHEWYRELRNPYFVVTFRDVLAAAQTELRAGEFEDPVATLAMKHEHVGRIVEFVGLAAREGFPLMVVSHERALFDAAGLVDAFARFFGVELTAEQRREALATVDPRRGYAPMDAVTTGSA